MPLETGTYITDLVTTNPAHSDGLNNGDAHIRLIKAALKATLPNANAPITATPAALSAVGTAGSSGAPSVNFGGTTEGFYKSATGQTSIVGQLIGNGALRTGAIEPALFPLPNSKSGGDATATKYEYLELDGGTYLAATYPELYAAGVAAGYWTSGLTSFTLPNVKDTGRFLRSRTASVAALTAQSNQNLSHVHTGTTDTQGAHAHNISITSGTESVPHTHSMTPNYGLASTGGGLQSNPFLVNTSGSQGTTTVTTGTASASHTHSVVGTTDTQGSHAHNLSIAASGGTEARPEALTVYMYVKT